MPLPQSLLSPAADIAHEMSRPTPDWKRYDKSRNAKPARYKPGLGGHRGQFGVSDPDTPPGGAVSMNPTRLAALLQAVDHDRRTGADVGERLCETCVEVLDVAGAGIMLMSNGEHRGTLGVSDAVIGVVEELQFTLGEGPCIDAYRTTATVLEPDLGAPAVNRWPAFAGPAVAAGVAAVFGFPLRAGDANVGALDLYLTTPADLLPGQVADAVIMAEVISATVLSLQADAAPGTLAPELGSGVAHRAGVHQASGMVSAQLDIDVADALSRIRAHAYTTNRPINDVARDIVARRLRLE